MPPRKVCVVVASRANYGSIKSAMIAIKNHADLELQLVVCASALLSRFGAVVDIIRHDGFKPDAEVYMIIEGETPLNMAKSTGLGLIELATSFQNLKPDIVLTVGDRFETMATAIAASYMNIPLAQTMGGEVSGTIDESIRHAITKLANIHFPANKKSAERIIKLGEEPSRVHVVGCPRIDMVMEVLRDNPHLDIDIFEEFKGVGGSFSLDQPFLLVSQHPVTTEFEDARRQIEETLFALKDLQIPTIMLWPNNDAGSDMISKGIRTFREHQEVDHFLHLFTNLPPDVYNKLMFNCACIIGNSSSGIREGAQLGTPTVNIGTRQTDREHGQNIINVGYERKEIYSAIKKQIEHGKYLSEEIYGDGKAGERIADILATCDLAVQKQITY
ncbi:UDP-N-acetylglucosamine 2-epimerase [Chloroflexota bacterium]